MARKPKITDKELIKWSNILGVEKMIWLYIEDKIAVNSTQLNKLIAMKNEKGVERQYPRNRYRG